MKLTVATTLTWALTLVFCTNLFAQKPLLRVGIGLASVRGELVSDNPLADPLGTDYSLSLALPLSNERWAFTVESSYSHQNMQRYFSSLGKRSYKNGQPLPVTAFESSSRQTYLGVGLRLYLTGTINRYNPYRGQVLPYLGLSIGGLNSTVFLTGTEGVPEGYELEQGSSYELTGEFQGGIGYVLNKDLTLELFGALRPGFNDFWDGIKGTTDTNDWLARGGVGLQYRF